VEAYIAHISGRVQGVGFRWFTDMEARARNVAGYVRNLPDGRVEVLAQADAATLDAFWESLRRGPRAARVDDVSLSPIPVDPELTSFSVRF